MFYEIALAQRWFDNPEKNPMEAVIYGDFEFLCERMALYNATK